MEQLPIDSETINKGLDIVAESTKETRKELDKTTAKGVSKLAQLFWASPIGIKADVYIQERPYKMKKAIEEMQQKYNKSVPVEYQVEPSSYIALKGVNELNYCLDEEHLKEMFENLLISDMDSRKNSKVLPSYIEVIKQLSKDDAKFLSSLPKNTDLISSIRLKILDNSQDGFIIGDSYIIFNYVENSDGTVQYHTKHLDDLILDNLLRLRIIECEYSNLYRVDATKEYTTLFNAVKGNYKLDNGQKLDYSKGYFSLTNFGKNFIDICLP